MSFSLLRPDLYPARRYQERLFAAMSSGGWREVWKSKAPLRKSQLGLQAMRPSPANGRNLPEKATRKARKCHRSGDVKETDAIEELLDCSYIFEVFAGTRNILTNKALGLVLLLTNLGSGCVRDPILLEATWCFME